MAIPSFADIVAIAQAVHRNPEVPSEDKAAAVVLYVREQRWTRDELEQGFALACTMLSNVAAAYDRERGSSLLAELAIDEDLDDWP